MFGSTNGQFVDRFTQRWVQFTGRKVDLGVEEWLQGPVGEPDGIGKDYFHKLAENQGLTISNASGSGLLSNFRLLQGPSFDPDRVMRDIVNFYERTSDYDIDAWSEWCGVFRPFGILLAHIFSRRLQQLNIPLRSLDTSRGLTSEILQLIDPRSGEIRLTAWLRQLKGSGNVLYAGAYSMCRLPRYKGTCVKVVFPLPNGNAIVIMRPQAHPDGSFSVVSSGVGFGDSGFYFTVHSSKGVQARYVRSMRETIRVYAAGDNAVRADHILHWCGMTFLRLHYHLRPRRTALAKAKGQTQL
jgi:hypothetical protein